jgi:phage tail-like protein
MPTGQRDDPYGAFNFIVEIDGVARAGFTEISGITSENDAIDYREGADVHLNVRKLPGILKLGPVTMKRGFTQDLSLWEWRVKVTQGTIERRNIAINLRNEAGQVVLIWRFYEAWPAKWVGPTMNAKTSEIAIEQLDFVHERMEVITA